MSEWGRLWASAIQWWRSLRLPFRLGLVLVPLLAAVLVPVLILSLPGEPATEETSSSTGLSGQLYSFPTATDTESPPPLLDNGRLFYEPGWGTLEVRRFLEGRPGVLDRQRSWVGDQEVPVADVITGLSLLYGINPKVLLALLEVQSGLVDDPNPLPEALDWAMGYREDHARGLETQLDWAVRELFRATRDYPDADAVFLRNGRPVTLTGDVNLGSYAVMRVVAQTGDAYQLDRLQGSGEDSFVEVYHRLFGEDPRLPLEGLSQPASEPFLVQPYVGAYEVTSVFDHHGPFLKEDGATVSHMGEAPGLLYDGHDGWDYALDVGVPVLAAADGVVAWAGNSDDGCATVARGVILDHGNGYQTIYWHLSQVDVQAGQTVSQGDVLGLSGASGCAEGPHLHLGVHFLGRETDPEGWCATETDPWAVHPAGMVSYWLWADRFSPCQLPKGAILVNDTGPGFQRTGAQWSEGRGGIGGVAHWASSEPRSGVVPVGAPSSLDGVVEGATWRPELPQEGRYRVYAFVPYWNNNTPDTQAAQYLIHHAEGESLVEVDQALHVDRWVDLGVYTFSAGRQGFVYLDNLTDEAGFCVWFDAVLWVPE